MRASWAAIAVLTLGIVMTAIAFASGAEDLPAKSPKPQQDVELLMVTPNGRVDFRVNGENSRLDIHVDMGTGSLGARFQNETGHIGGRVNSQGNWSIGVGTDF